MLMAKLPDLNLCSHADFSLSYSVAIYANALRLCSKI